MKIIAFTDLHGAVGRAEKVLAAARSFDVVVVGGDLTTRADPSEAEAAIGRLRAFGRPVLAVAGNMDLPAVEDRYRRLGVALDSAGAVIDGVGFFGVSGCPPTPMKTPYEIPETEIARRIGLGWDMVRDAAYRVFVPHAPPHGTTLDRTMFGLHVGSKAVRTFVEQEQPDLLICGHIHEARGMERLGATEMVNCGPGRDGCYAVAEVGDAIRVEIFQWPE